MLGLGLLVFPVLISPAFAQTETAAALSEPSISARKIFIMLFLMLGPIKILVPFVNLTRGQTRSSGAAWRRAPCCTPWRRWQWPACWAVTSLKISRSRCLFWP